MQIPQTITRVKKKKKEKRLRLFKCGYVNQRAGMFSDCIETAKRQKNNNNNTQTFIQGQSLLVVS